MDRGNADAWPVCVVSWEMDEVLHGPGQIAMGVQYRPLSVKDEARTWCRRLWKKNTPNLKRGRQNVSYRTLSKVKGLDVETLPAEVQTAYNRLDTALKGMVT